MTEKNIANNKIDIGTSKKTLRKICLEKRNSLPKAMLEKLSEVIIKRVIDTREYQSADKIFTYVNANSEIITLSLIEMAINDGKTVAVPVMSKAAHEMDFIKIEDTGVLVPNKYGIPEPTSGDKLLSDKATLVIVPGLAFGRDLSRTGYGGGYYDKFMSENDYLACVGVAMDFQIFEKVISESHDRKLDMIITENEIIK